MKTIKNELISDSMNFMWNFYERVVSNYSVIIRLLSCLEEEKDLIAHGPEILVKELSFDVCKVIAYGDHNGSRQNYFSIKDEVDIFNAEDIGNLCADTMAPFVLNDVFEYGAIYVYPLKNKVNVQGCLLLGKRTQNTFDDHFTKELGIICNIYNQLLFIQQRRSMSAKNNRNNDIYKTMFLDFPDMLFLLDRKNTIFYVNKRAEDKFKNIQDRFLGEKFSNLFCCNEDDLNQLNNTMENKIEYFHDDEYRVFSMRCYTLVGDNSEKGQIKCIILRDILNEKIENQQTLQRGKTESISLLAGGIAHDFNNLLTGILGYTTLMKNFLGNDDKLLKYATAIENSAQRAAKLTGHLLNFSRRQGRRTEVVDINSIVNDLAFLIRESYRDIKVAQNLCENLPPIKGDEAELQNAFLNVFNNAKDAMNGKGVLNVTTGIKCSEKFGKFAIVEIKDSGQGMNDETKKMIFEPYFSTKHSRENMGMGLYLVKKTINHHGGFIEIDSKEGRGTIFTIYLPLHDTVAVNNSSDNQLTMNRTITRSRVLIVDDEDFVREFLKEVLCGAGLDVLEAGSGEEAVKVFKEFHGCIDLVILDMIMPGMKGNEVMMEMRKIRYDIRIVIASGFMSEEQRQALQKQKVNAFLDKPFKYNDLIDVIKLLN